MCGSEFVTEKTCIKKSVDLHSTLQCLGVPLHKKSCVFGDNESVINSSTVLNANMNKCEHMCAFTLSCVCIHGCTNVSNVHGCMHACAFMHEKMCQVHTCMHMNMHVCDAQMCQMCMAACMHVHSCMKKCVKCTHACSCTCMCVHSHTCAHVHVCVHAHAHVHVCAHAAISASVASLHLNATHHTWNICPLHACDLLELKKSCFGLVEVQHNESFA